MSGLKMPPPATACIDGGSSVVGAADDLSDLLSWSAPSSMASQKDYDFLDHDEDLSSGSDYEALGSIVYISESERVLGSESSDTSDWEDFVSEEPKNLAGMPQSEHHPESHVRCESQTSNKVNIVTSPAQRRLTSLQNITTIMRKTMSYNLKTYLSQTALYVKLLAALFAAGCDMIKGEIIKGIQVIVTRHVELFHSELRWLTAKVMELNRQKESMENQNRHLKQDNNSWKALWDVEADRRIILNHEYAPILVEATQKQYLNEKTSVKTSELSHEVSVLQAEKNELRRQVTETNKDREVAIKQLHTARTQNEQLKQETWMLKDEIDGAWKGVPKRADYRKELERLVIRATFLVSIAINRGFCDFTTVRSTREMKNWLASSAGFWEIMREWRAVHGEEYFSNEEEEIFKKYDLPCCCS